MKKNYALLALLSLSMPTILAENTLGSLVYGWYNFAHHLNIIGQSAYRAGNIIKYTHEFPLLKDVPVVVINFCRQRLQEHTINPDDIQIKLRDNCSFLETFGKQYIAFNPACADEFAQALENQDDPKSARIIKIYSTFLDHEIAHLKNNDTLKRNIVFGSAATIGYLASLYVMNSSYLSELFKKPTTFTEGYVCALSYSLTTMATNLFITSVYAYYAQCQEYRADAYAIAHAKDSEALQLAARFLEHLENSIIDFLCSDQEPHPNIPVMNKFLMKKTRSLLVAEYRGKKIEEEFRVWVQEQKSALLYLKLLCDLEHPSGFARAEIMRNAANNLSNNR